MDTKAWILSTALVTSLGLNATLIGAGAATATTLPQVLKSTVQKQIPKANGVVSGIRSQAAAVLCDESEADKGLAADDCSVENVCIVRLDYCDGSAGELDDVLVNVTFGYAGSLTLSAPQ